jgi:hypothetical protein
LLSIILKKYAVALPPTINVSICTWRKVAKYTVSFGALDERHLYLSDLTKDFIPNRPWWVVGSPEKG